MNRIILAAFLALALPGCAALQAANGTVSGVAPAAMVAAKKALIAAHSLHEAAADAATIAANSNICVAACATRVKGYIDQSELLLVSADLAVKAGDTPGIQAKVSAAIAIISQVESLTSGAKQ